MAEFKGYKESDDHTPNPLDMRGTFQTTRTGVPQNPDAISEVFAQDRRAAAERAKAALDGEGGDLYFSEDADKREAEEANLRRVVEAALAEPEPTSGSLTKAQQEAAEENDGDNTKTDSSREQPDISDAVTQQNTSATSVAATSVAKTSADTTSTEETAEFDPSTKSVTEVNEHLATASDEERERVLAAEREGKNRSTVDGI